MPQRDLLLATASAVAVAIFLKKAYGRATSSPSRVRRHLKWVQAAQFKTLQAEMETAVSLAVRCGEAMLSVSAPRGATLKDGTDGGIDPQTATDVANEQLVMGTLQKEFPSHAVIGEETSAAAGKIPAIDAGTPTWIIDPIDGTQNFCHALPESAVSIGLCVHGTPALGVIYDPFRDELYVGIASEAAAYLNGSPLPRVDDDAEVTALDKAMVLTDVGYERSAEGARRLAMCHEALLRSNTFAVRIIGTTVLALAWLAAGRASAVYMGLHKKDCPKAWDWCAANAICTAVGVPFHRLQTDAPFDLTSTNICVARSPALAMTLRSTLRAALGTAPS